MRNLSLLAESKGCYNFTINSFSYTIDYNKPKPSTPELLLVLANKRNECIR